MSITLNDYIEQCDRENGGLEHLVVVEHCDIDFTNSTVSGAGEITALTLKSGKQGYKWTPDIESAMCTDNGQGNRENNSYLRTQTAMIIFKDDEDVTAKLDEDSGRTKLVVFAKYSRPNYKDAKYKAFGYFNGLALTTSEASTGQLFEDLRGHTLNFEGKELVRALKISDTLVDAILNPTS